MAIHDLLWACPECGAEAMLRPEGSGETCGACGTHYRQRSGGRIAAVSPAGSEVLRDAAQWVSRLPEIVPVTEEGAAVEAAVELRRAVGDAPIRVAGEYLGRVELFGEGIEGTLRLTRDAVSFAPARGGAADVWTLQNITAVQLSSDSLQINVRGQPLLSLHFHTDSPRLWEARLATTLQALYDRKGWGRIVELQPRIAVAPDGHQAPERGDRESNEDSRA